jgi:transcriptional regulator with XRE-family HTH domain
MHPFGETVLAWRFTRGMTQAELANAAGIARPNLSAIERGDREVTLRTLRALALALDVRPGALVDGEMPDQGAPPLTRAQMERIAEATVSGARLADPRESALSGWLAATLAGRLAGRRGHRRRVGGGQSDQAYFRLRSAERPEVVASLLNRVLEKVPTS